LFDLINITPSVWINESRRNLVLRVLQDLGFSQQC